MMINESFTYRCGNRVEVYKPFFLLRHLRNNLRAMIARMAWMFGGRNVAMDPLILGFGWQWQQGQIQIFKKSLTSWDLPFFQCITCFSGNHQPPSKIRLPFVAKELLPLLKWMLVPLLRLTAKALKQKWEPKGKRERIVFHPTLFRGELFVLGSVNVSKESYIFQDSLDYTMYSQGPD